MYIILGREAADALKENHTVLELETLEREGKMVTAFCVVNSVPFGEMPLLENYKSLHADFIKAYNDGNYKFCIDSFEHLVGKFGGELDTFYIEILRRINP
jgi:hypothetical protein